MTKWLLAVLVIALPQVGNAKVYMCIDQATGKTSFTDKACETPAKREEVRIESTNLDSGSRYGKVAERKTWNSERDQRKSGRDYNAQRRDFYDNSATAGSPEPQKRDASPDGQSGS